MAGLAKGRGREPHPGGVRLSWTVIMTEVNIATSLGVG